MYTFLCGCMFSVVIFLAVGLLGQTVILCVTFGETGKAAISLYAYQRCVSVQLLHVLANTCYCLLFVCFCCVVFCVAVLVNVPTVCDVAPFLMCIALATLGIFYFSLPVAPISTGFFYLGSPFFLEWNKKWWENVNIRVSHSYIILNVNLARICVIPICSSQFTCLLGITIPLDSSYFLILRPEFDAQR